MDKFKVRNERVCGVQPVPVLTHALNERIIKVSFGAIRGSGVNFCNFEPRDAR